MKSSFKHKIAFFVPRIQAFLKKSKKSKISKILKKAVIIFIMIAHGKLFVYPPLLPIELKMITQRFPDEVSITSTTECIQPTDMMCKEQAFVLNNMIKDYGRCARGSLYFFDLVSSTYSVLRGCRIAFDGTATPTCTEIELPNTSENERLLLHTT